jgi:GAF domain-containing protein
MRDTLLHQLRHPIVAAWRRTSISRWRELPHPVGDPTTRAGGPDADRLLIVGAGIAVGYGVLSHALGLGGHLVRRLSELTKRGASATIHGQADLTLRDARALLGTLRLTRFDAVLLACGASEAATLRSPRAWRRQLTGLLTDIDSGAQPIHVFVLGIPLMGELTGLFGALVRQRAALLNAQSQRACDSRAHATYVEIGVPGVLEPHMSMASYDHWARVIAPQLVEVLDGIVGIPSIAEPADEPRRQQAVDSIGNPSPSYHAQLLEVVTAARDLFGVVSAAVHIIDGDEQRVQAAAGPRYDGVSRGDSICDYTIQGDEVLVVEDTLKDERFRHQDWATGDGGVRFYAGCPLESPDGERVGAFCIIDTKPRAFTEADRALLRQLALHAQTLLWSNRDHLTPEPFGS